MRVPATPSMAFDRFVHKMGSWWPLDTHGLLDRPMDVIVEGIVGGGVVERDASGEEARWAVVTRWDPPRCLELAWHPGEAVVRAQDVVITFVPEEAGTRVTITHRGWQRVGIRAATYRDAYALGWPPVLERFRSSFLS